MMLWNNILMHKSEEAIGNTSLSWISGEGIVTSNTDFLNLCWDYVSITPSYVEDIINPKEKSTFNPPHLPNIIA